MLRVGRIFERRSSLAQRPIAPRLELFARRVRFRSRPAIERALQRATPALTRARRVRGAVIGALDAPRTGMERALPSRASKPFGNAGEPCLPGPVLRRSLPPRAIAPFAFAPSPSPRHRVLTPSTTSSTRCAAHPARRAGFHAVLRLRVDVLAARASNAHQAARRSPDSQARRFELVTNARSAAPRNSRCAALTTAKDRRALARFEARRLVADPGRDG